MQVLDGSVEWTVIAALGIPINLLSALIVCGTGVHVGHAHSHGMSTFPLPLFCPGLEFRAHSGLGI